MALRSQKSQLAADMAVTKRSLRDVSAVAQSTSRRQRAERIYFEHLHLSPLKLRVSFSLNGTVHSIAGAEEPSSLTDDVIAFFLSSIGAFTEIKEVELRYRTCW